MSVLAILAVIADAVYMNDRLSHGESLGSAHMLLAAGFMLTMGLVGWIVNRRWPRS